MNNNEFLYFFHGTNMNEEQTIKDIFKFGLLNYRGNSMSSTMWPVEDVSKLAVALKQYCGLNYNKVFIIKIPKRYLYPRMRDGKIFDTPLPIWKRTSTFDMYGRDILQLAPELIYGVYRAENESVTFNPDYFPVYDCSGMLYDECQIDYLANGGAKAWYDYVVSRKNIPSDKLKEIDNINHTFESAIQQYSKQFGVSKINFNK